jgi:putative transposase
VIASKQVGRHRLKFFNTHAALGDKRAFKRFLARCVKLNGWSTASSFAGPEQMLRYLSRYTHRVAISNRRLVSGDDAAVPFRWKDYRAEGPDRWKTMTRMSRCASK